MHLQKNSTWDFFSQKKKKRLNTKWVLKILLCGNGSSFPKMSQVEIKLTIAYVQLCLRIYSLFDSNAKILHFFLSLFYCSCASVKVGACLAVLSIFFCLEGCELL